ncbi:SufE family protein [Henriciella aquimarina]|uniref:SufE family protein n=1 Tax=Henriciella aquimarina TaxID=545261 RepID=UPI0009FE8FDD|nr:SufE family protein [Henriciella aquimarina]
MTVQDRADDIAAEFDFLDDWETRYAHIIDLGKQNPTLEPDERSEETRVRGCASQVWMVLEEEPDDRLKIRAESDAMIVSGLIALLIRLFSEAPKQEILDFDAPAFLEQIGVTGALSAQRSNGLNAMLERIRSVAAAQSVPE